MQRCGKFELTRFQGVQTCPTPACGLIKNDTPRDTTVARRVSARASVKRLRRGTVHWYGLAAYRPGSRGWRLASGSRVSRVAGLWGDLVSSTQIDPGPPPGGAAARVRSSGAAAECGRGGVKSARPPPRTQPDSGLPAGARTADSDSPVFVLFRFIRSRALHTGHCGSTETTMIELCHKIHILIHDF